MVKITIYVEGGGEKRDSKHLKDECRRGFRKFLEKSGLRVRMPRIVACGSRTQAFRNFQIAVQMAEDDELPLLLVDSEGPVAKRQNARAHLATRDKWNAPSGTDDDQIHLMVQCMESWFLADSDTLSRFFGQGFQATTLRKRTDIENIRKADVFKQLTNASRNSKKRAYSKGAHSFTLLAEIDPAKVIACSPFARRLIDILKVRSS